MLLESNPEIGLRDGIYQNISEPYRDPSISPQLSNAVTEVFNQANDKSLFSLDIQSRLTSSSLESALSIREFRFLEGLRLNKVNTVLDLSEDFGGVGHFLADSVGQVESVKIDPGLAKLSTIRCANKHNVCHISADLELLCFPTRHYDLIVIGQLEALKLEPSALHKLLRKLRAALSDNGVLILNVINNNRVNKWFDPRSVNMTNSLEFSDLYKAAGSSEKIDELDRKQLRDALLNNNFESVDIHACFSSSNNYKALFSENYLTASVNAINHFHRLESIEHSRVNEFLFYNRLIQEKQNLTDYASRFIAFSGANSAVVKNVYNDDFRHFPNPSHKPEWQTTTSRLRSAQTVITEKAYPKASKTLLMASRSLESQPYFKGALLVGDWLQALIKQDHRQFDKLVTEYIDYIAAEKNLEENQSIVFDVTPTKIIVKERGGRRTLEHFANGQYFTSTENSLLITDFLLFRALFWFALENNSLLSCYASHKDIPSVGLFILEHMPNVHQEGELAAFAELEQKIQSETINSSHCCNIAHALLQCFTQANSDIENSSFNVNSLEVLRQTASVQNSALIGQSHRLKLLRTDIEHQATRISDLQDHREELVERLKDQKEQKEVADNLESILRAEIDELHQRLHTQNVRNAELHGYLLMRPTTRATRVAKRTLNRITGRPEEVDIPEPEPEIITEVADEPLVLEELIGQNKEDYQLWISENTLSQNDIEKAKIDIDAMPIKPIFSILVPIYDTPPEYLLPMIESVQNQIYPHWQLCLVDDCSPKEYLKPILEHQALKDDRISIKLNTVNQGISVTSNDALAMAKGDYIALLDHDDEISIDALFENAKIINSNPGVGLIYSDEDKLDMKGVRVEPYFKPDYSPDLLHTNNYICHFTVIKKELADQLGGFREGLDGSQDHDIIIRAAAATDTVVHIPKILYHWRKIPGSTAVSYDSKSYAWEAGRRAVEDQLSKDETGVKVEFGSLKGTYRVFREIKGAPLVSIVIPFKDQPDLLVACLNSILNRSSYQNLEIIGVSNNSEMTKTFELMEHFKERDERISFTEKNIPFNFSSLCNHGVAQAKGDYIVLLNNDIEVISSDWVERLLEHAQRDEIGAVGGKLLYPDGRIQHAGVVAGMVGAAGHPHKFFPDDHIGYHGRLHMVYNVSAVTGAMLMVKKAKYEQVGGLDEENLAVAYNDIDFCLKLLDQGYRNVFTPHSKATHYESISRGYEDTDEKVQRLLKEQKHFLNTWSDFLEQGDPYYNPNLSLKNERFSLTFKD